MKKYIKHLFTTLLNVLGITSLTSCLGGGGLFGGGVVCMYGVPCNSFTVTGIITGDTDNDGETEPVNGIRVKMLPVENTSSDSDTPAMKDYVISGENEENGAFLITYFSSIEDSDFENKKFIVSFEDIDGEENGSFENKNVEITFGKPAAEENFTKKFTYPDLKVELKQKN